ncbi:hypothetical protein RRG08_024828 [Elysia crispata]|uniref:Uncharacterized protein n=1 Tax=Elysia crispata TaxID=231223 RepID=A0AAE1CZR6_9GAST|nr:hypothetical protein RRG08_024828 [Elysia crispata]
MSRQTKADFSDEERGLLQEDVQSKPRPNLVAFVSKSDTRILEVYDETERQSDAQHPGVSLMVCGVSSSRFHSSLATLRQTMVSDLLFAWTSIVGSKLPLSPPHSTLNPRANEGDSPIAVSTTPALP